MEKKFSAALLWWRGSLQRSSMFSEKPSANIHFKRTKCFNGMNLKCNQELWQSTSGKHQRAAVKMHKLRANTSGTGRGFYREHRHQQTQHVTLKRSTEVNLKKYTKLYSFLFVLISSDRTKRGKYAQRKMMSYNWWWWWPVCSLSLAVCWFLSCVYSD